MFKNVWKRLSSSQKLSSIGSILLIISLFLTWFNDKDVFRSGDSFSALNGPLYFVGYTIFALALLNLALVVGAGLRVGLVGKLSVARQGKLQMTVGFASMYLLVVINSVYFSPQFGLNILEKRSDIGVLVALAATVMVCVGGYLCYRQKFADEVDLEEELVEEGLEEQIKTPAVAREHVQIGRPEAEPAGAAQFYASTAAAQMSPRPTVAVENDHSSNSNYFSERDPRGKTDYERSKLYENLKRTMQRDTLSPEQRRKMLAKETKDNAFSANFGKNRAPVSSTTSLDRKARGLETIPAKANTVEKKEEESQSAKKPQMYRMDL